MYLCIASVCVVNLVLCLFNTHRELSLLGDPSLKAVSQPASTEIEFTHPLTTNKDRVLKEVWYCFSLER